VIVPLVFVVATQKKKKDFVLINFVIRLSRQSE